MATATVRDILSVDISDWDAPGVHTTTKPAHELPPDAIQAEVWAQLKDAINSPGDEILTDDMKRGWYLDRDISRAGPWTRATSTSKGWMSTPSRSS